MSPDATAGIILAVMACAVYFLPTVIGMFRGVAHPWLLFIGNFLGFTILGWFIALCYAVASEGKSRPFRTDDGTRYYDSHSVLTGRRLRATRQEPRA